MPERGRRLSLLISDAEHKMLQELAERAGLTASDFVRQFLRKEHEAVFGALNGPSAKPRMARKRKR